MSHTAAVVKAITTELERRQAMIDAATRPALRRPYGIGEG